jgi:hypothetical protein
LPAPIPFVPDLTIDQIGVAATTGVAALAAAHGAASYARQRVLAAQGRRAAIAPPVPEQQPIVGASAALSAGGSLTGEVPDVIEPATFALPVRGPAPVDESEPLGATAEGGLAEGATSGLAGPSGPSEPPAPPAPSEPSETEPSETEPSETEPSEAEPSEAEAR